MDPPDYVQLMGQKFQMIWFGTLVGLMMKIGIDDSALQEIV